jgi:hypothetical protein
MTNKPTGPMLEVLNQCAANARRGKAPSGHAYTSATWKALEARGYGTAGDLGFVANQEGLKAVGYVAEAQDVPPP